MQIMNVVLLLFFILRFICMYLSLFFSVGFLLCVSFCFLCFFVYTFCVSFLLLEFLHFFLFLLSFFLHNFFYSFSIHFLVYFIYICLFLFWTKLKKQFIYVKRYILFCFCFCFCFVLFCFVFGFVCCCLVKIIFMKALLKWLVWPMTSFWIWNYMIPFYCNVVNYFIISPPSYKKSNNWCSVFEIQKTKTQQRLFWGICALTFAWPIKLNLLHIVCILVSHCVPSLSRIVHTYCRRSSTVSHCSINFLPKSCKKWQTRKRSRFLLSHTTPK